MTHELPPGFDGPILQALLDLLPGTLHVKDRAHRYCIVNRNYLERWGRTADEVVGRTTTEAFGDFFGREPDKRNTEVFASAKPLPFYEVTYPDPQGGSIFLWATKVPIFDAHGAVTHVLTFSLDVTPLKRAQAELERQRQALYQSERLSVLGTLAAGISHELRNPLSVVLAQAKLLEDEIAAGKPQARLSAIVRAAERCAGIVRAFLDQSRSGPRKVEHVALAHIVDSALELCAHVLREQRIALTVEHSHPGVTVEGDPHQLSQVVLNLLLNASEAMQASARPRKAAIRTCLNPAGDTVELTVSDTGPGIAQELRSRIFERFFTTKSLGAGTGLGLAICREIVTAHGGHIGVDQAREGGALFRVLLPVADRSARAESDPVARAAPARRQRILVVDDEHEVAELLCEILALAGHEVDAAHSGRAALERLGTHAYDLVLSDMRMPGMDGAMLYDAISAAYPGLAKRFALVTGDTLSAENRSFLQRTGVPCLSKPFEPRQVIELIAQLVGSDALERERSLQGRKG